MVQIDMEMPKKCKECKFFDGEDVCNIHGVYAIGNPDSKPKWCPLIPVDDNTTKVEN